jgi:Domain of unknown function (DUF6285)
MPSSMPDSRTLLDAAIKYLEEELLPELSGYHRFKLRVTTNVLITIKRELELGKSQATAEHARLIELLGYEDSLVALNVELAERIRAGTIDTKAPAVRDHIRKSLAEALAINNPKWLGLPRSGEQS